MLNGFVKQIEEIYLIKYAVRKVTVDKKRRK